MDDLWDIYNQPTAPSVLAESKFVKQEKIKKLSEDIQTDSRIVNNKIAKLEEENKKLKHKLENQGNILKHIQADIQRINNELRNKVDKR